MEHLIRPATLDDMELVVAIDDDACRLFAAAGVHFAIGPEHPFAQAEYARWRASVAAGHGYLALDERGVAVGIALLGEVDGAPYLDQLSVRMAAAGRGLGRQLLRHAIRWAGERALWLTTYAHIRWNRPFYEREGFVVMAECGAEMQAILHEQRCSLPAPHERIAMCRRP